MSSQADRERIADAIRRGGEDAGEIFCVPARHASDYRLVPLAWAAVITLVVPAPLIYLTSLAGLGDLSHRVSSSSWPRYLAFAFTCAAPHPASKT